MLIDTHSHLNFKDFDKDRDEVIKRSFGGDIFLINVGSDYESSVSKRSLGFSWFTSKR
jgi:Tat protein secretion system quality control protein TatD with DNase activity